MRASPKTHARLLQRTNRCPPPLPVHRAGPIRGLVLTLALLPCCRPADPPQSRPPPSPLELRVLSLSPAASRLMLSIGAAETLVAVDAESRVLPGLGALPVVEPTEAAEVRADLVLLPRLGDAGARLRGELAASSADLLEIAPHDFDEAFELCLLLGNRLGRGDAMRAFVNDLSRELVEISTSSHGYFRPRIAAVVRLAPLEIAGGHSFATDLIEVAGGESITHGGEDPQLEMGREELERFAPDLVVVVTPAPTTERQRSLARTVLGDLPRLAFLTLDPELIWLEGAVEVARELRTLVEPLATERAPAPPNPPNPVR